jgi:hypothetical protein
MNDLKSKHSFFVFSFFSLCLVLEIESRAVQAHTLPLSSIPSSLPKSKHSKAQFIKIKMKFPCFAEKKVSKRKASLLAEYL